MRNTTIGLAMITLAACGGGMAPSAEPDAGPGMPGMLDAGPAPIVAAPDVWTWVDFPDSKCASGTPTGIAVNPHAGSHRLVIFLEGGGSCADADGCWVNPTAVNLTGYGAAEWAADGSNPNKALLGRTTDNPFADANFVFVPYCTGDFHAGTASRIFTVAGATKPTYFWGGTDLDLFLARVAPTFPGMAKVVLVGTSAGGAGTIAAYHNVRDALHQRVDVIDDSGPPIGLDTRPTDGAMWGLELPAGCPGCTSLQQVFDANRALDPTARFAQLSFQYDNVVAKSHDVTLATYHAALEAFLVRQAAGSDRQFASFVVDNDVSKPHHVVMSQLGAQSALRTALMAWLAAFADDTTPMTSRRY
jgi:hypothetical protein